MDEDEEYELAPHKQIERLKKEVERLRNNPLGKTTSSKDLLEAVDTLTQAVYELNRIFKIAAEQVKYDRPSVQHDGLQARLISQRMDTLSEENKKIASALISLSEAVKDSKPAPFIPPSGQRQMSSPGLDIGAPPFLPQRSRSSMPPPGPITPLPPRPPSTGSKERKSFFEKFKK